MLTIINMYQKKKIMQFGIMQRISYYYNIIKKLTNYETFIDCLSFIV